MKKKRFSKAFLQTDVLTEFLLFRTDMLLACLLVAIQKVLSTLPHFLSPYLLDITLLVSLLIRKQNSFVFVVDVYFICLAFTDVVIVLIW